MNNMAQALARYNQGGTLKMAEVPKIEQGSLSDLLQTNNMPVGMPTGEAGAESTSAGNAGGLASIASLAKYLPELLAIL